MDRGRVSVPEYHGEPENIQVRKGKLSRISEATSNRI